ncbi:MAG: phosphotransacetylase, partial [Methanocorpusculum sp.]|nr:phosphotransacetylase [Methanocorpusculum sp.]
MITIGIGCEKDFKKVFESSMKASSKDVRIRIYSKENPSSLFFENVEVAVSDFPEKSLVDDLRAKKIDAAVRGTLPANDTLKYLKKVYNVSRLERIALLESADGNLFFFAPVGVDAGWTVEEKVYFVNDGRKLARAFGISDKTAVL